jgi:hypothetical protein
MIGFIKKLFGSKPAEPVAEVPYKVEAPVAEVAPTPVAQAASEAVVKSIAPKAPAKKTAPKKAAPKKQPAPAKKSKPKA